MTQREADTAGRPFAGHDPPAGGIEAPIRGPDKSPRRTRLRVPWPSPDGIVVLG